MTMRELTDIEWAQTFQLMKLGLEALAELDNRAMSEATDFAYQKVALHAAGLADAIGEPALHEKLSVAVVRCHHCEPT